MSTLRSLMRTLTRRQRPATDDLESRRRQRGQVLPIFVMMSVVLLGGAALLADVAWWWTMEQKMQRAADAGALAGAVHLPARQATAFQVARDEARKNGFTHGQDNVVVTPRRDPSNPRKLIVDIDAPVDTFFAKVFSIVSVDVGVTGAGEFTLPVPMGSPENYYGVFGPLRAGELAVASTAPAGAWTYRGASSMVEAVEFDDVDTYARTNTQDAQHVFGGFGLLDALPTPGPGDPFGITGIEVLLNDTRLSRSCGNSYVQAHLSWNGGASWSSAPSPNTLNDSPDLGTTVNNVYIIGSASDTRAFPGHTWVRDDLSDANFRLRLTATKPSSCSAQFRVDQIRVRVNAEWDLLEGPGTPCANGLSDCFEPDGASLNPRGFWATMNTRGAANVNGDAHQPKYINPTSTDAPLCGEAAADGNACYDPDLFYNYAVEMPPGSSGGYVYVFDPGFCETDNNKGVGDRWFSGSAPVSSWYELFEDTRNTPYDYSDDTRIATSDRLFTNMDASDTTLRSNPRGRDECAKSDTAYGDGRDYHLSWYLLNPSQPLSGGASGQVYRLHTTGTDPAGNLLGNENGEQSFALYVKSNGGSPRIYGLAAMQMFTPLKNSGGSSSSEFYLAQIDEAHAGKKVELKLWDPGDTGPLRADLQVLLPQPTGGWAPSSEMMYSAKTGTTHSTINTACNTNSSTTPVSQILTNQGGGSKGEFNGCWLTVEIPIPADYTGTEDGWWKIRYNMSGSGTSNDVTTWKVRILNNPVHLVPE